MQRKAEVAATGILLMAEATHSEKMQVIGTETTTMSKVFFSAIQNTSSWNRSL